MFFRLLGAVRSGNSPRSNLSAWLYRVANNSVMDVFRRMPPEELELTKWLERTGSDPADAAERHIEMERAALRELTEGQQQVIVLKFLQGMDSSEVGAMMGRSEGAVDALQQRDMRALRRALQQQPS